MPTDASVPRTVAIKDEATASKSVFFKASIADELENISPHHFVEKPVKIYVLEVSLNEKSAITTIGA